MENNTQKNNINKELLTIREVAGFLGVHQQTLRRWDVEGKLKSIRVGQFGHRKYKKSDIENILKKK